MFKTTHLTCIFYRCAKAYKKDKFEYYMSLVEATTPFIRTYLVKANYRKWARSDFNHKSYNITKINILSVWMLY